jgi:hypothetical protein
MQESTKLTHEDPVAAVLTLYERITNKLLYDHSSYETSRSKLMSDIAAAEHYINNLGADKMAKADTAALVAELSRVTGVTDHKRLLEAFVFSVKQGTRMAEAAAQPREKLLRALVIHRAKLYGYGYPTFNLGHKLAASLAVTKPALQRVTDMRLPFEAFTVNLPEGLFVYADGVGVRAVEVSRYKTSKMDAPKLWVTILTDDEYYACLVGESIAELLRCLTSMGKQYTPCATAVLNSVLNLTTLLCDKSAVKPIGSSHASWAKHGKHRAGQEPTRRVFQVAHDIQHDFRNELRQYTSGKGHKLTVQFMVRGHWTHQVHGEGRALRRLQFIEPYWKGDTTAPIALRSHRLELSTSSSSVPTA